MIEKLTGRRNAHVLRWNTLGCFVCSKVADIRTPALDSCNDRAVFESTFDESRIHINRDISSLKSNLSHLLKMYQH